MYVYILIMEVVRNKRRNSILSRIRGPRSKVTGTQHLTTASVGGVLRLNVIFALIHPHFLISLHRQPTRSNASSVNALNKSHVIHFDAKSQARSGSARAVGGQ
ncbi:hypothetical protein PMIN07_001315 [Paraphaeosphaeria minitans]